MRSGAVILSGWPEAHEARASLAGEALIDPAWLDQIADEASELASPFCDPRDLASALGFPVSYDAPPAAPVTYVGGRIAVAGDRSDDQVGYRVALGLALGMLGRYQLRYTQRDAHYLAGALLMPAAALGPGARVEVLVELQPCAPRWAIKMRLEALRA